MVHRLWQGKAWRNFIFSRMDGSDGNIFREGDSDDARVCRPAAGRETLKALMLLIVSTTEELLNLSAIALDTKDKKQSLFALTLLSPTVNWKAAGGHGLMDFVDNVQTNVETDGTGASEHCLLIPGPRPTLGLRHQIPAHKTFVGSALRRHTRRRVQLPNSSGEHGGNYAKMENWSLVHTVKSNLA